MKHLYVGLALTLLAGCGVAVDDPSGGSPAVAQTSSALTENQVTAMNQAAQGTSIHYALVTPADTSKPQTLRLQLGPNPVIRRRSTFHLAQNTHVADVVLPPDVCEPPDVCRTRFDIAGANYRIVGTGGNDADGRFVATFPGA